MLPIIKKSRWVSQAEILENVQDFVHVSLSLEITLVVQDQIGWLWGKCSHFLKNSSHTELESIFLWTIPGNWSYCTQRVGIECYEYQWVLWDKNYLSQNLKLTKKSKENFKIVSPGGSRTLNLLLSSLMPIPVKLRRQLLQEVTTEHIFIVLRKGFTPNTARSGSNRVYC